MLIIASMFSCTAMLLMAIGSEYGFRLIDIFIIDIVGPNAIIMNYPLTHVILPLIRICLIIAIWCCYCHFKPHKKDKQDSH